MEMSRLGDRFRQAAAYGERIMVDEVMGPAPVGPQFDTIVTRQPRGRRADRAVELAAVDPRRQAAPGAGHGQHGGGQARREFRHEPVLGRPDDRQDAAPGVVNVVNALRSIGDAPTGHPLVRNVNFTGSPVGRHVMKVVAENLTPVTLSRAGRRRAGARRRRAQ